jgi:alpha-glucosidase (family GH31 glycosyl hydrolase)
MWGSDVGGFFSFGHQLTPELLIRWIQFAAFTPVMRTKAGGIELPAYRRPQIWDPDILAHWVRWSRWHTRLNDYLMAAHETYRRSGRPIMCALELVHPAIGPVDDEYFLGPHLLVAPVLEPGVATRRVVVPPGRWRPLFADGPPLEGPGDTEVPVTLEEIPVFVRDGAELPLLPDDGRSLSPYARRPPG